MSNFTPVRFKWHRAAALLALVIVVAIIWPANNGLIGITIGGLLSILSFGYTSNWVMRHVHHDGTQEFIAAAVWFGLYASVSTVLQLSQGWLVFGLLVALSGGFYLIGIAEPVIVDLDAPPRERRRQSERARLQTQIRHMTGR